MSDQALPPALIKKTFLADVPERVYSRLRSHRSKSHRSGLLNKLLKSQPSTDSPARRYAPVTQVKLNIAGWVSLPYEIHKPVSLLVIYKTRDEEQAVVVDEMNARGASEIMLSGTVDLLAHTPIETVQIFCGGIDDKNVRVSDLHVSKVNEQGQAVPKAS